MVSAKLSYFMEVVAGISIIGPFRGRESVESDKIGIMFLFPFPKQNQTSTILKRDFSCQILSLYTCIQLSFVFQLWVQVFYFQGLSWSIYRKLAFEGYVVMFSSIVKL